MEESPASEAWLLGQPRACICGGGSPGGRLIGQKRSVSQKARDIPTLSREFGRIGQRRARARLDPVRQIVNYIPALAFAVREEIVSYTLIEFDESVGSCTRSRNRGA